MKSFFNDRIKIGKNLPKAKLFNQTLASDDSVISAKSVLKKQLVKGKENDPDFHSDESHSDGK